MHMTRRSLLMAGAVLALGARSSLTVAEVIDRIKLKTARPWSQDTVDKVIAGNPKAPVTGIAVTMMATLDVLQRAAAAGANLVITHEPTFYSHLDTTDALQGDPTFLLKKRFIEEHGLVVFRFHDNWHDMTPDGIDVGMARKLGWEKYAVPGVSWQYNFPATPLDLVARQVSDRLGAHSLRLAGDPALLIRGVATNWGYASLLPDLLKVMERRDVDLLIVGETREWELVEFVDDQIASGAKKSLIVINHVVSEQAGMEYCAEWLRPLLPGIPIAFVPAHEPLRSLVP